MRTNVNFISGGLKIAGQLYLPDGEYDVFLSTTMPVLPGRRTKARPGDRVRVEILDLAPRIAVGLRVLDAARMVVSRTIWACCG